MPELERENVVASVGGDANFRLALDELLSKSDPLVAELYVRLLLSTNGFQDHRALCDFLRLNCEYRASILLEVWLKYLCKEFGAIFFNDFCDTVAFG